MNLILNELQKTGGRSVQERNARMGELPWFVHLVVVPGRKVFHFKYIPAIGETILCNHILRQCRVRINQVHRLRGIHFLRKLLAQRIDARLDYGLEPPHRRLGEEAAEGSAPSAVERMTHSSKSHSCATKHTRGPGPLLYILGDGGIELIDEI